jgi:acetolactate synthase-1/3 small subunit
MDGVVSKRYTLSVQLENKPGALTRVTGLFARRAFNIHSLAVGPMKNRDDVSRAVIITDEYGASIEQIVGQLQKLVYVLDVKVLGDVNANEHEVLMDVLITRLTEE